jgi:hypothetical protein
MSHTFPTAFFVYINLDDYETTEQFTEIPITHIRFNNRIVCTITGISEKQIVSNVANIVRDTTPITFNYMNELNAVNNHNSQIQSQQINMQPQYHPPMQQQPMQQPMQQPIQQQPMQQQPIQQPIQQITQSNQNQSMQQNTSIPEQKKSSNSVDLSSVIDNLSRVKKSKEVNQVSK